jgi:elongator complex protein 3
MYKEIFDDPALRPDMIKIYPNTVIPSAELYQWFLDGRYTPYGPEALFDALLEMKRYTPRYCRISRLIRDIPEHEIKAGNMITNLRQDLEAALAKNGERCVCLRCRELGRQIKHLPKDATPQLFVDEYETVGGKEFFITYEDANRQAVYGFLRLRIPTELPKHHGQIPPWAEDHLRIKSQLDHLMPEVAHAAFIRELHTYGQLVGIGETSSVRSAAQHRGLGKGLVAEAERIAHVHGATTLAVISGVGVRGYYNKLGYETRGTYVVKDLT